MFVDLESVIYASVRSSLLQEQILMFCSINLMSLSQNATIEINLYYSLYVVILAFLSRYKYCRIPFDNLRHETQYHGYLLLLITSYIHHIALFHIILSTLPEIVNYVYVYMYLYANQEVKKVFTPAPFVSFRSVRN